MQDFTYGSEFSTMLDLVRSLLKREQMNSTCKGEINDTSPLCKFSNLTGRFGDNSSPQSHFLLLLFSLHSGEVKKSSFMIEIHF